MGLVPEKKGVKKNNYTGQKKFFKQIKMLGINEVLVFIILKIVANKR